MLLSEKLKVIEVYKGAPEAIRKIIFSNPKYRVEIEIPEEIFDRIGGEEKIAPGHELLFQISSEKIDPKDWDLYAWGLPYIIKEKEEGKKILISMGGLQCIITSSEKIDLKLMEKIYLMIKVL
ncbi:MAG TPA: hypothetical protein ENG40_01970 [Thermoprotei archaeon]|nr:hypothetical protein [Thermoprotei archaeon]